MSDPYEQRLVTDDAAVRAAIEAVVAAQEHPPWDGPPLGMRDKVRLAVEAARPIIVEQVAAFLDSVEVQITNPDGNKETVACYGYITDDIRARFLGAAARAESK